jgi:hypothetical protein
MSRTQAGPVARALALVSGLVCGVGGPALAQGQGSDQTLLYSENGLTLRWHLQAGLYFAAEGNAFWDLAATTVPGSGYDPDKVWQETYLKPGVSFEYNLDGGAALYGKLSGVWSNTRGLDPYDEGDNGATTLEEAYVGLRGGTAGGLSYDLSLGARELQLGTGMLISNGATSGFERGALKFGPRKAWERSAILRVSGNGVTGTAFFLDPNELPSTDGKNALAGLDLRRDMPGGGYLGGTYVKVLQSETPYPQAAPGGIGPPTVTPGAREGTQTFSLYAKTEPFAGALQNWTFTGDLAYQWNDRIDLNAWAGRVQASYAFTGLAWSPTVTYGFQSFSGDDPNTTALERFDPLYYQGSPSAWATGTKSASTFINSNVNAHSLAVRMKPSQRDTLTFRYAHVRANELRSPVQFGQASRVDTTGGASGNVITGVTDPHLADDFFLEYNRVLNRNVFLTALVATSIPGEGVKAVTGGSAPNWNGASLNVVVNF